MVHPGNEEDRVSVSNNSYPRKKEVRSYISNFFPNIENKYKLHTKLVTCVFNPHDISLINAWLRIPMEIYKIKQIISARDYKVAFAVLTVEVHGENDRKKSRKCAESEETKTRKQAEKDAKKEQERLRKIRVKSRAKIEKECQKIYKNLEKEREKKRKSLQKSRTSPVDDSELPSLPSDSEIELMACRNLGIDPAILQDKDLPHIDDIDQGGSFSDEFFDDFQEIETAITPCQVTPKNDPTQPAESLTGYPHIHIALFMTSKTGKVKENHEIGRDFTKSLKFGDDIKVTDGENKRIDDRTHAIGTLEYVLKDSNHDIPYHWLRNILFCEDAPKFYSSEILDEASANNVCLFDFTSDIDVINFFNGINERKIHIHMPDHANAIVKTIDPTTLISPSVKRAKQDNWKISMSGLINAMNENNLKLCKGVFYKRVEGTRRTYKIFGKGELSDVICLVTEKIEDLDDKMELAGIYLDTQRKIQDYVDQMEKMGLLPTFKLDWSWIEFKDFYLYLPTYSAVKGELPPDIHCFHNFNYHSLEEISDFNADTAIPRPWMDLIENQPFYEKDGEVERFLSDYYKILLPLTKKSGVFTMIGVANSGKSTIMEPIKKMFGIHNSAKITEGQFGLQNIEGKRVINLDDTAKKDLDANNILQLFGNDDELMVNQKYKEAKLIRFDGNIFLCLNELPDSWIDYSKEILTNFKVEALRDEIATRLRVYVFERQIPNYKPGSLRTMHQRELEKVIILSGHCYATECLGRPVEEAFHIYETFEEIAGDVEDGKFLYGL